MFVRYEKTDNNGALNQIAALFAGRDESAPVIIDKTQDAPNVSVDVPTQAAPEINVNLPQQETQNAPTINIPPQDDSALNRLSSMLGGFIEKAGAAFRDMGGDNIPVVLDTSNLVVSADALPAGGNVSNVTNTNSAETKINNVNVYTQADDAKGIADSIPSALQRSFAGFNAMQADGAIA